MTRSAALRALNARRLDLHLARLELLKAVREVERIVYRTDLPLSLRKQA
jgi:hypothetical protein